LTCEHAILRWAGTFRTSTFRTELDFGGLGKEYAADRAAEVRIGLGARCGLIDLGGDIRTIGPQPDGCPWRIGIRHPRDADKVVAEIALSQGALATSGDYERFLEIDSRRYCHILEPAGPPKDLLPLPSSRIAAWLPAVCRRRRCSREKMQPLGFKA
jgi:thiamine biosynthesis lipoprotein